MCLVLAGGLLPAVCLAAAPRGRPLNIIVYAVDGLRADRLGVYGYRGNPTTPTIDRLSREAVVFENAESQSSWTLPSFASLFTSLYPHQHGAVSLDRKVPESAMMLAETLKAGGYRTAAFVGGPFLNPEYGFAQGFDVFNAGGERYFNETLPAALDWLRANKGAPFFLFVHGNDVHPPFNPALPDRVRRRFDAGYHGPAEGLLLDYYFVRVYNRLPPGGGPAPEASYLEKVEAVRNDPASLPYIASLYDAQIARVDESFGALWDVLRREKLLEDTVVVIMADHGLELGEHGLLCTGYHATLYESITHVPLIVWAPGATARRVPDVVQLVDVAPTVLDLARLSVPAAYQGASLSPLLRGGVMDARTAFGSSTEVSGGTAIPMHYARREQWKLIYRVDGTRFSLYDLTQDAAENSDLSAARSETALALSKDLLTTLSRPPAAR